MKRFSLMALLICTASLLFAHNNPEELGKVNWLRDYDAALAQAKASERPVLILFQEVPGCGTCVHYGNVVLSHPLIVEAMEDLFVPLAIYNNAPGKDAAVLNKYREPAWNNPVVRIVNAQGDNLVDRVSRNYAPHGVVDAMVTALERTALPVPAYLSLFQQELQAQSRSTKTAAFSMYCFWTGEKTYGQMNGVVSTEPGFMKGREVVLVEYDPEVTQYQSLLEQGKEAQCAGQAFCRNAEQTQAAEAVLGKSRVTSSGSFRADGEPKYYMSKTDYRFVPMTAIQATKVNARIGQRLSPDDLLSPRQRMLHRYVQEHPKKGWENMIGKEFVAAWGDITLKTH